VGRAEIGRNPVSRSVVKRVALFRGAVRLFDKGRNGGSSFF
jgi:hypothetical protein